MSFRDCTVYGVSDRQCTCPLHRGVIIFHDFAAEFSPVQRLAVYRRCAGGSIKSSATGKCKPAAKPPLTSTTPTASSAFDMPGVPGQCGFHGCCTPPMSQSSIVTNEHRPGARWIVTKPALTSACKPRRAAYLLTPNPRPLARQKRTWRLLRQPTSCHKIKPTCNALPPSRAARSNQAH
jgi:hypothetical protein